jgi:hypothetical protein
VLAVFLTWLATRRYYVPAAVALLGAVLVILLLNILVRSLCALFCGAEHALVGCELANPDFIGRWIPVGTRQRDEAHIQMRKKQEKIRMIGG